SRSDALCRAKSLSLTQSFAPTDADEGGALSHLATSANVAPSLRRSGTTQLSSGALSRSSSSVQMATRPALRRSAPVPGGSALGGEGVSSEAESESLVSEPMGAALGRSGGGSDAGESSDAAGDLRDERIATPEQYE